MPAIRQALPISQLKGHRRQCFTVRVFATGAVGAGNLTIKCTGTGYTASSSEQINVALAAIPGTYTLYSFYLNTPANIPSDLTLTVAVTGANLGLGGKVYLDSCQGIFRSSCEKRTRCSFRARRMGHKRSAMRWPREYAILASAKRLVPWQEFGRAKKAIQGYFS